MSLATVRLSRRDVSAFELSHRAGEPVAEEDPAPADAEGHESLSEEEDENKMPTKLALCIGAIQIFMSYFSFSIVIPTSYSYARTFNPPAGFPSAGILVGAASAGSALVQPLYRFLVARSFAGALYFQCLCMFFGSVLYAVARLAGSLEMVVIGRMITGLGATAYPVLVFCSEHVGKRHRSNVMSWCLGVARSLGYSLGPIFAAVLVYVDFRVGELTVDKDSNPGWVIAIASVLQMSLVAYGFPRQGSRLVNRRKAEPSASVAAAAPPRSTKEKWLHGLTLFYFIFACFAGPVVICAWEMSATNIVQNVFGWSIQSSALLVGGMIFTTLFVLPLVGKLSYRILDVKIERYGLLICLGSMLGLFDYVGWEDKPWTTLLPYMLFSFLLINAITVSVTQHYSHVSKVTDVHLHEPMQMGMNTVGFFSRGVGSVAGDFLTPNALGALMTALLATMAALNICLTKQLKPKGL